jgi:hypothetical protein
MSTEQQREAALLYLCGISKEHICRKYSISSATLTSNIVPKYSREWKDDLVEFYRETHPHNRLKNSAHMRLAFNHMDVPHYELVRPGDHKIYSTIEKIIYRPTFEAIIESTSLEKFLVPSNCFERLLKHVSGTYYEPKEVVNQVFNESLLQEYMRSAWFSMKHVTSDASQGIIDKIKYGEFGITPLRQILVLKLLNSLSPREQKVLKMRNGIPPDKVSTLSEIGLQYDITKERVRQIERKTLWKLRHHHDKATFSNILEAVSDEELIRRDTLRIIEKERPALYEEVYKKVYDDLHPRIEQETIQKFLDAPHSEDIIVQAIIRHPHYLGIISRARLELEKQLSSRSVDELELKVRSANCLAKVDIRTIDQLIGKTENYLLRMKNFGWKSLKEIKSALKERGLSLASEE